MPRSVWLVDEIGRTAERQGRLPLGASQYAESTTGMAGRQAGVRTALCDTLGIEHPIVGFTPSEHVAAAISRAGGLGVLGCVRFNDPAELDAALTWMDENTDGRPYGVDVVMPATVPTEGTPIDLAALIPPGAQGLRRAHAAQARRAAAVRRRRRPARACSAGCTRSPGRMSTSRWRTGRG